MIEKDRTIVREQNDRNRTERQKGNRMIERDRTIEREQNDRKRKVKQKVVECKFDVQDAPP